MSHLLHSLESSVASPAPSVTTPLAEVPSGLESHSEPGQVKAVGSKPESKEFRVDVTIKAEVTGDLAKLPSALATHDLVRAAGQDSIMSAQDALDNITALLHRQLNDSFASTSSQVGFERPAATANEGNVAACLVGPHHRAGGARERRWAEHEAVVTGKDNLNTNAAPADQLRVEQLTVDLAQQSVQVKAQATALAKLEKRLADDAKVKRPPPVAQPATKPIAPLGTVARTVHGLLDEIKAGRTAPENTLPYFGALMVRSAGESSCATVWREVVSLVVASGLVCLLRAGSHARLCRDLAKQPAMSGCSYGAYGSGDSRSSAVFRLVNDRCLATWATAPDQVHAADFMAELFECGVLYARTLQDVLVQLLVDARAGNATSAEAAYHLLKKAGKKLDVQADKALMDAHFARLRTLEVSPAFADRVDELVNLRAAKWA